MSTEALDGSLFNDLEFSRLKAESRSLDVSALYKDESREVGRDVEQRDATTCERSGERGDDTDFGVRRLFEALDGSPEVRSVESVRWEGANEFVRDEQ